jgi:hypothetical protein
MCVIPTNAEGPRARIVLVTRSLGGVYAELDSALEMTDPFGGGALIRNSGKTSNNMV